MFRHLSLTTSTTGGEKKRRKEKKTQHSYATVGHFVNRRDGSVALKCQNKWRTRKEKDRSGEKAADTGSELAGMDFTRSKWTWWSRRRDKREAEMVEEKGGREDGGWFSSQWKGWEAGARLGTSPPYKTAFYDELVQHHPLIASKCFRTPRRVHVGVCAREEPAVERLNPQCWVYAQKQLSVNVN